MIVLDNGHYSKMCSLHKSVNPEEIILGWCTTGNAVTPTQMPVHTFFAKDTRPFSPIHLLFDTEKPVKSDDCGIRAYTRYVFYFLTLQSVDLTNRRPQCSCWFHYKIGKRKVGNHSA